MAKELVSVLLLSMNHEKYVKQACESILSQTWSNIEVLYVDNYSADSTFEIADTIFRSSGLPYKGYKREKSYGISANLNFLLKEAKGEFVAVLSGDDWWEDDNLQLKVNILKESHELGLVHSNGHRYFEHNNKYLVFYEKEQKSGYLFEDLLSGNLFSATSIVYRYEAMKSVGFFDEKMAIEDWDMNLRISEKYRIGYLHRPLTYARITGNNTSKNIEFMDRGYEDYLEKYANYPQIREADRNLKLAHAYQLAHNKPDLKSLIYILRNLQLRKNYLKQIIRCLAGMVGFRK